MGLYDTVTCKYKLPEEDAQELSYQSKDTPEQYLRHYEITEDGRLMLLKHDEDWQENEDAPLGFECHQSNPRWVDCNFCGAIEIYTSAAIQAGYRIRWVSWLFWFKDGKVVDLQPGPRHEKEYRLAASG